MTVGVPPEYIEKVLNLMENTWFKPKRMTFAVKEAETLAGQLAHIANSTPWLSHIMPHLYMSIADGLKGNQVWIVATNKQFCEQIKKTRWLLWMILVLLRNHMLHLKLLARYTAAKKSIESCQLSGKSFA